ncbi:MAG: thiamine-binding protein [Proteobacteria bacterium]|nr:thiamine-binding protein [Pseudomonadota bacterium]
MQIAVDISLYPLTAGYLAPIKSFIERLGAHPGLALEYNSMSTQVRGDLDVVFDALRQEAAATFAGPDRAVLVLKVIGGPLPGG